MQLIVGNRLTDFAEATGAITAQAAIERLAQKSVEGGFVIGQGVRDEDARVIRVLGQATGVDVHVFEEDGLRAGRSVCHKHDPVNELISMPRKVEENVFEADMLMDDRNEIMSDHLTGLHLQGMLLIEATRQMFIAVGETQYSHLGVPKGGYVVFNRLDTRFEQFAFPIPTVIRQSVTNIEQPRSDRTSFSAHIELFQEQGRVASTYVEYTIFEAASLKPKEEKLACKAVESVMRRAEDAELTIVEEGLTQRKAG
ncbi:AfsA-related hotdog domain-containing protein [Pseudovibrio exalbescens]|uniref:AfsA-related hotdog domain-containing protein n=1 Tax=Pseudovibrio exalbescens TaxID=197461 RepID=UPI0023651DCC|nr:AfsA-related hotdog domain-containing protein [Pseudovibrio exalbescens]MDD7911077.1 AfsA-related hotdog domain-containing protein [Pseudovibrio exalbescens]